MLNLVVRKVTARLEKVNNDEELNGEVGRVTRL
jgi:hypothetical protein